MKGLKNRLVYLFTGEFFAMVTFVLVYIYFYHFSSNHSYSLLYMIFVLNFILLQGSFYWFIKWKGLKNKRIVVSNIYKFFSVLKKLNLILVCIAALILIKEILVLELTYLYLFLVSVFVYAFAVFEYINYFHTQLTNYKNGRGQKSSIAKGIERIKS
ncbi:signal transduction histidine kinase [Sporosarcina luteola]|nr:signal transduction histidine kinase [Sporosarcina luteola]